MIGGELSAPHRTVLGGAVISKVARWLTNWTVAWVMLVGATGFAGWAGWSYWQAGHDGRVSLATERDQVLEAAKTEIASLNSLSSKHAAASLQTWLTITTGNLRDQIHRLNAQYLGAVRQSGRTARGTVTAVAVTGLQPQVGTAQVIAVVRIDITATDGSTGMQSNRYQVALRLTSAGWKVSSLMALPAAG